MRVRGCATRPDTLYREVNRGIGQYYCMVPWEGFSCIRSMAPGVPKGWMWMEPLHRVGTGLLRGGGFVVFPKRAGLVGD